MFAGTLGRTARAVTRAVVRTCGQPSCTQPLQQCMMILKLVVLLFDSDKLVCEQAVTSSTCQPPGQHRRRCFTLLPDWSSTSDV